MESIRANTPKDYDFEKHTVLAFSNENYQGFYTRDADGYYTYKGESSDTSVHYSESALLGLSEINVVEYTSKKNN